MLYEVYSGLSENILATRWHANYKLLCSSGPQYVHRIINTNIYLSVERPSNFDYVSHICIFIGSSQALVEQWPTSE
jgi:hypothetical protein